MKAPPFAIDASELESAMRDVNHRIKTLPEDVDLAALRALHRDVSTIVDVLWLDEWVQFFDQFTRMEKAKLIAALRETAASIPLLPHLPQHAN